MKHQTCAKNKIILIVILAIIGVGLFFTSKNYANSKTTSMNTAEILKEIHWNKTIKITIQDKTVQLKSNGIPNHKRNAQYLVPKPGIMVPDKNTAVIADDPTKPQNYNFTITTTPQFAAHTTKAPLGSIGLMISGAVLFNPYEADDHTIAMASNFCLPDANGNKVWFVDACSGHPTPREGMYHYHGLPNCVTSQVDKPKGPSHIIGIALDGLFIYGANDIHGKIIDVTSLDECNGINSPTPEFPNGVYHYVLPGTQDETSSIRCFKGEVDPNQIMPMPPM